MPFRLQFHSKAFPLRLVSSPKSARLPPERSRRWHGTPIAFGLPRLQSAAKFTSGAASRKSRLPCSASRVFFRHWRLIETAGICPRLRKTAPPASGASRTAGRYGASSTIPPCWPPVSAPMACWSRRRSAAPFDAANGGLPNWLAPSARRSSAISRPTSGAVSCQG